MMMPMLLLHACYDRRRRRGSGASKKANIRRRVQKCFSYFQGSEQAGWLACWFREEAGAVPDLGPTRSRGRCISAEPMMVSDFRKLEKADDGDGWMAAGAGTQNSLRMRTVLQVIDFRSASVHPNDWTGGGCARSQSEGVS